MDTPAVLMEQALAYHRSGDRARAGTLYKQILDADPEYIDALHMMGVLSLEAGRPDQAVEILEQTSARVPFSFRVQSNLATAYRANHEPEKAVRCYQQALGLNPQSAETHNNLGNVLRDLNRLDQAEASYRRALMIAPGLEIARDNLKQIQAANRGATTTVDQAPRTSACRSVLHVGCGPQDSATLHERFREKTWREVRLDIDPAVKPDIVASLVDMQGVGDSAFDAVWSSHNLEHLFAHEVPLALGEFFRVLKPEGQVIVTMPDMKQIAELIAADKLEDVAYISPAGPIAPLDCVYGLRSAIARGNEFMAHRTGFTAKTLQHHLTEAGFVDMQIWTTPFALWAEANKPAQT